MTKKRQKEICVLCTAALLILAVVSAEFFVPTHFTHDCIGEHCPMCEFIRIAQNLLEGLARAAPAIGAALAGVCAAAFAARHLPRFPRLNPVSLKVKSNR
jgi:hypothetical protein